MLEIELGLYFIEYCTKQLCKISFESLDEFSSYWNFMKFDFSKWPISKTIFRIMLELKFDLYVIVINSCAKYHLNPLTRFQVIGRNLKNLWNLIFQSGLTPKVSDHAGNRTWPVFYWTKQLCKISFKSIDAFSSYWSETFGGRTDGRTHTKWNGGYNIIPRHFVWRGIKTVSSSSLINTPRPNLPITRNF